MEIIDISNVKECRICFIDENGVSNKPFINPCACSGTSKWVHIDCLNRWRESGQNPTSENICSECRTEYNIIRHHFDVETLIYKDSYIQNINMLVGFFSFFFSFMFWSFNSFLNDFILIIIGFGNKPDFIDKRSYMSTFIYVDISAFFVFNSIIIYLIINIFKQVKHKKIYFRGIRSKLIQLSTFNLLFLPLYQIGIFLNSLNFIIYSYTTGCFFLTFTLKSLLRKSNSIITSINDGNYIEDTILPYDPISGDISDDPSGDISGDPSGDISGDSSDDSSEINDIENDNETFLLPENHS